MVNLHPKSGRDVPPDRRFDLVEPPLHSAKPQSLLSKTQPAIEVTCPYCQKPAKCVTGDVVYARRPDLKDKFFYECIPCDAYVGCHQNSKRPLGRLANATLRKAKKMAHEVFDKLWRNGGMTRDQAYAWLAKKMELSPDDCHIGKFDEWQCAEAIIHCSHGKKPDA